MLRRKTASPYFVYSLLIHSVLLLMVWWLVPKPISEDVFYDGITSWITRIKPPPIVKPPVFVEPAVSPAPPTPKIVPEKKPPTPPKPKAGSSETWQLTVQDSVDIPQSETRREEPLTRAEPPGSGLSQSDTIARKPADYTDENRLTLNSVDQPIATLPLTSKADYVAPQGEMKPVALETDNTLDGSGSSPTIDAPKIHYGSERGDALQATSMGNSWGGGGTAGGGNVGGAFVYMMKEIARTLVAASTAKKVDIVFVLDETASMVDNIRGIRAYVDFLFDAMEREGHDVTFGLVTFRDKTKIYGQTDDLGTFKNWLVRIGVDGGGDIAEAGLDGLMDAVTGTKFRKDAQRFIILASDGAFHDADYNGRSVYSLDEVIETLQREKVRVDVIGIDYLPIRQIALATGGTWRAIPGRGYFEYVPPLTLTVKLFSKLGTLRFENGQMDDNITIYINNPPRPKQLTLTWKVLNPLGERCYGPFTEKKTVPDDGSTKVELTPMIDSAVFQMMPGVYTVIYRLENDQGHRSILRRTLTF